MPSNQTHPHCHLHRPTMRGLSGFFTGPLPLPFEGYHPLLVDRLASPVVGGAGHVPGWIWLAIYILMIIGFFGFLEIRVMCSHCPHYAESGSTLSCWANYGSPKLWAYRPGPMSVLEHVLFITGLSAVYGFPLVCFALIGQWFLLLVYFLSAAGFLVTLRSFFCSACMNFACTLNTVDEAVRQDFFSKNPGSAEGWGSTVSPPDSVPRENPYGPGPRR